MPRKASTVRLDQRPLAAGLVSTAAKAQVLTEGRRALHPMKVAWLGIDQIDETPPELNSRQTYDEASINELAVSIKAHGILQPICVRPKGERYELVFGMRRYKAAVRAGAAEVPCTIQVADDERAFLLNTIENLHQKHLSGAERVRAIERLAATNLGVRDIARRTGFTHATISRWLKIDQRPDLKDALEADRIDVGRTMVLVAAPDEELAALLAEAPGMRQQELKERVAALNVVRNVPVRSVDSRRIMEALRVLSMVRAPLADEDRGLLVQVKALVDGLLGQSVSEAEEADQGGRSRLVRDRAESLMLVSRQSA
jgi:ParB family transcriptional regulator, chromosome partitioning protein